MHPLNFIIIFQSHINNNLLTHPFSYHHYQEKRKKASAEKVRSAANFLVGGQSLQSPRTVTLIKLLSLIFCCQFEATIFWGLTTDILSSIQPKRFNFTEINKIFFSFSNYYIILSLRKL